MKNEYNYSILSLVVLLLGLIACILCLLFPHLTVEAQSVLIIFGICFITIGISSYTSHHKKYIKMSCLKNGTVPILGHWHYAPHSSPLINELIKEKKVTAIYTTVLTLFLAFTFAFIIYLTNEAYSIPLSIALSALSLLASIALFIFLPRYYDTLLNQPAEVIFGEDCFCFLDELFCLQKSIYLLGDVRIDYSDECSLQFLYGSPEVTPTPSYQISIPIPPKEMETAQSIQSYYLDLITWIPPEN
ncbi:hypothetical protein CS063_13665 [Sporanaerobium hydrogeniformans]|uniref:Uncharacterized protein n=1 Tax=Sporanaerobium hydrogeniformans TaxID=3072179 RepID=A0AC61DAS5_9FIRM|nr:hypothetical protein [Sporanaerobium hydrogeniformans]PHV69880.1 hypothetical protein CS063_13665 [Sporanaerobium hydrogeniformans]